MIHSLPQSSRNRFGTPINRDLYNNIMKATTLFREILFDLVMPVSVEHIQIFFPHK